MSLVTDYIKELGGYEYAKDKSVPWLVNHGLNWRNVKEATLLKYRREHNIFEVGDKVVFKDPNATGVVYRVTMIHANSVSTLCPINRENGEDLIGLKFTAFPIEYRHTTDAEIEAGKRLEVV